MHPGGFEPPTARFVAEYSIQLSYGCIGKAIVLRGYSPGAGDNFADHETTFSLLLRRIWCIREDYSAAPRPSGRCLRNVILPGTDDNFADHETTFSLLLRRIWCIREDYSAAPRPSGRCLRNVILPGTDDNFADHETTFSLLLRRIWCIREDSNLRPLGS